MSKFNECCISPIYKKKDPDNIANYRPIILLNTDYKIFTKALSLKLVDAAPSIIHPDQAGFLKNRSIFDQVKMMKMVTDYMNMSSRKGTIIALDQEKVYDKILHLYLWQVLRKFEFPEEFIQIMQSLYDNALATAIRASSEIKGIPIPRTKKALKIKLFTNNTTVFLSETDLIDKL